VTCSPQPLSGNTGGGACNVLKSTLSPAMGRTCGRRERRTGAGYEEEQSSEVLTSQRWKAPWFVGCRQPSRVGGRMRALVGPSRVLGARPQQANAPMTAGVLWKNEEGNVVSVRQAHALFAETPNKRLLGRGHVLHSVQRPVHVNRHCNSPGRSESQAGRGGASALISRSGKPTKVGANRHRGLGRRTNARLAARHRFSEQSEEVVRDA
jgi:hypothetical protein